MGFYADKRQMESFLETLGQTYRIFAPKCFQGKGRFSDTDCVRYGEVGSLEEIVFDKKSEFSFKEILTPVSQTLFYFTEDQVKEPEVPEKGAVVFLRSCDLHALKRLDQMYQSNGPEDYYYAKLRKNLKLVLMSCSHSFENCFCVSMGSNRSEDYDLSVDVTEDGAYRLDCKDEAFGAILSQAGCREEGVEPSYVTENQIQVQVPENLDASVAKSSMWEEYTRRCINCGRCNFVCPTCTCFTMQDIFYSENGRVGERRRVWASCMVDGFTDVAGGGSYRQQNGQRMRFKVLHKVLDYKQRNGRHMCVGCGRCDDICPEYISFSNCINKLEDAMKEVNAK
ncbi:MAG: anaerobic sulfite reductase subunit AsrA [Eubacteriales bacterium]|nr:anaerobic sulfite reductase subunit AsrA [Eubacteriales bacterium]